MTSRTERILIIDADEQARSDLSRYLEARGFYVTGYPDLSAARCLFNDVIPDVIFADLSPEAIRDLSRRLDQAESFRSEERRVGKECCARGSADRVCNRYMRLLLDEG